MKNKIESCVIVYNGLGYVATMRFEDIKDDKIVSSTSRAGIYSQIEKHVAGVNGE